jgi:hypothetical protein
MQYGEEDTMRTDEEVARDIALVSHGDGIVQEGDRSTCTRCGLVWDTGDRLPPLCQRQDGLVGPDWGYIFRDPYEDPNLPIIWPCIAAIMMLIAFVVMYGL